MSIDSKNLIRLYRKLNWLQIQVDIVGDKLNISAPKGVVTDEILEEIKAHKEELLHFIDFNKRKKKKYIIIPRIEERDNFLISSSQGRLWVLSQFGEGNIAYNVPGVYEFEGKLDRGALEQSFRSLIERHEILRTVFKQDEEGEVKQCIKRAEESGFGIEYRDMRKEGGGKVKEVVQEAFVKAFDLAAGPLIRASLLQVGEDKYVFVYVMHH